MDRPCLTRVHTHGFTRKPFAGNNLNPISAPCLTARETRAVATRKQPPKSSAIGPPTPRPPSRATPHRWRVRAVVAARSSQARLIPLIRRDPEWRLVFQDEDGVVFVHR